MACGTITRMDTSEKVRENRLRDTARRRGYQMSKSRLRDPLAVGYGRWHVTARDGQRISGEDGWTLDDVEAWLTSTVEVSLESGAADAECFAVAEVFESAGIRAVVRGDLIRRSADLAPWLIEITAAWTIAKFLGAAAAGFADEAGRDAWKGLKRLITGLYKAREASQAPEGEVTLKEEAVIKILLPSDLPDQAYRRLYEIEDLSAPLSGILRWDNDAQDWTDVFAGEYRCSYPGCSAWATQSRVRQPAPAVMLNRLLCDLHATASDAGDMTAWE
jgi:hypothetical protein